MRVTVSVSVDVASTRFEDLERACWEAAREGARQAITGACHRLERRRRRGRRGGRRKRQVLTRVGWVTLSRGRARRPDGSRYFPLDEQLGLPAHHEGSPAVRRRGCELAACHPYREAARLLAREVGAHIDHRALWRWVQADGDHALRERAAAVDAMFTDGEAPPRPGGEIPEALTLAVDATGIRLTDGTTGSVKLGVAFTGSEQVGRSAKRRLLRRHIVGDIADSDAFGQLLAYELERVYGGHRIPRTMLLGDGEPWIRSLRDDWLPTAAYQCDWWHLSSRLWQFCGADPARHRRLIRRAFRRPARLARDITTGRLGGDPEEARLLGGYLEHVAPHLYTFRRMGPGRWLHGSGPSEKHIELGINRRFKRRGMRWSHRGARRLLAIRMEVIATA